MKLNQDFKNGLKDGLPIGLGYFPVAFAFGVKASILLVPAFITILISMTNLTSVGQLAGLDIIATLGSFAEIIVLQLVINSRYFLMSISLSQNLDSDFDLKSRLFYGAFITDEIFAVTISKTPPIKKPYFLGVIILPYLGWTLGTVAGAFLGNVLPPIVTNSLGIALYAMFIAIIVPPASTQIGALFVILLSTALSCCFYYIPILNKTVSSGFAVIICAVASSLIIAYFFPVKDGKNGENEQSEKELTEIKESENGSDG